jgi:hypothetical protein
MEAKVYSELMKRNAADADRCNSYFLVSGGNRERERERERERNYPLMR